MKKWIFLLVLILITSGLSFYFHEPLSRFYQTVYYRIMTDESTHVEKARKLYNRGRHKELAEYIDPFLFIYPENHELKRIAGLNLMALGDKLDGAEIISSSIDEESMKRSDIIKVARILYRSGSYGDLVSLHDRGILKNDVNASFYYGVSLYHLGRFPESFERIRYARSSGYMGGEIDFYTALNLERAGRDEEALAYLESAYRLDRKNRTVKKALIRLYRKLKKFSQAERIIRSI